MRKGKIKCNTNINTLSTCVFSDHRCTAVCMHMCTVVYSTDSALVVCLCISAAVVWTSSWLRPSSSEADVSPAASSGLTVGNSLHVIVCAMNCWWRICLCARLNNGNIKYLVRIIIIHFLATIEIWLITWKLKISKQAVKWLYFVEMKIFLHTPCEVNITSVLNALQNPSFTGGQPQFLEIPQCWFAFEVSEIQDSDGHFREVYGNSDQNYESLFGSKNNVWY